MISSDGKGLNMRKEPKALPEIGKKEYIQFTRWQILEFDNFEIVFHLKWPIE